MLRGEKLGNNLLVSCYTNEFCDKAQQFKQVLCLNTKFLLSFLLRRNDVHNVHFNDALLLLLFSNKFRTLDKGKHLHHKSIKAFTSCANLAKNLQRQSRTSLSKQTEIADLCHVM